MTFESILVVFLFKTGMFKKIKDKLIVLNLKKMVFRGLIQGPVA